MNGTTTQPGAVNANQGNSFPWAGQPDETACNLAFGNLVRNLPPRLMSDGKMHAPTLMAAAGAVAGICAQISLLADAERLAKAQAEKKILEVTLKDGRRILHGEALNEMLYSVGDAVTARSRIYNMLVSAAVSKGMDLKDLPDVRAMFKHVSDSFGTDKEGRSSVAANAQPMMHTRDLLKYVGPVSFAALGGEIDKVTAAQAGRANRKSWVAISAQAAANMLLTSAKIMPPALCLTVAMEAAIYASKLHANRPEQDAPKPQ